MDHEPKSRARENLLAIALTIIAGAAIWFFLDLVTMGLMSALLAAGVIFTVVIVLHYLTWGRAFSDQVAAEREALRRQDELEGRTIAQGIQDITHKQGIKEK